MYEKLLSIIGLSPAQSAVYEALLSKNFQKAGEIAKTTQLKRGLVYKILEELVTHGLSTRTEPPGKVAVFSAVHPDKLRELAKNRADEAENARQSIESLIPQMTSTYNLSAGKPGVRFFEGIEGIKKVWWDSLNHTTEILTFGDLEFLAKNFGDLNASYLKERLKNNIPKRAITNDSIFNRGFLQKYDTALTQTRLTKNSLDFASVVIQIYNGKISFTSLTGNTMIGVIVEDKLIYQMQKNLFEYLWTTLGESQTKTEQKQNKPGGLYEMTGLDKFGPMNKTPQT